VADNQPAFRIDNAAERIDLDFAPLVMRNHFNSQYAALSMPAISCQGTSEAFQLNNEAPLRILFYIGFGTGVTNLINSYPFATTTRYDSMANVVLPINYTAAEFAHRYWDQTIAWLRNRIKIEFQAYLTANELLRLAFHKKQMLLDSHFLIEEAFAEIDGDLKYVQIKGFTG
jgi:hypothetical protein